MTTVEDPQNVSLGLRTYVAFKASQSGSVTFRLSVLEDTSITPETFIYEKYTGENPSPNPDYPQEIEIIEGYNLFKGWKIGQRINDTTGEITVSSTAATAIDYIPVDFAKNSNYYLSGLTSDLYSFVSAYDKDKNFLGRTGAGAKDYHSLNKNSFGSYHSEGTIAYLQISLYENKNLSGTVDLANDLKTILNVGTTPKPYLPYQNIGYRSVGKNLLPFNDKSFTSKGITFTCQNGELILNGTSTGEILTNDNIFKNNFAFTLPAGNYKLQMNDKSLIDIYVPMTLKKVSDGTTIGNVNGQGVKRNSFTLTEETEVYFGLYIHNKTFNDTNVYLMLEDGDIYSNYEPHQETITPIDLKENFVGKLPNGVADNLLYKDRHIYLKKNVKKRVLNGTES
ncbi:MAG: hypothetical protein IJV94_02940 [Bacilli bacterium]|nr:hypothetical protein [Bacilli bacterium]